MFFNMFMLWAISACSPKTNSTIVPQKEYLTSAKDQFPKETQGITANQTLGLIQLQKEFPSFPENAFFRLRALTIAPDGSVAGHEHNGRPGIAYILEGTITEYRQEGSIERKSGDHSFEDTGIRHGWKNHSDQPVHALVADIWTPDTTPDLHDLLDQQDLPDAPHQNDLLTLHKTAVNPLQTEGALYAKRSLRLRVVSLAPKGIVRLHEHDSRPGFAYVVSGKLIEHRGDGTQEHTAGSAVSEKHGLKHWWENIGTDPAHILVIDIITQKE